MIPPVRTLALAIAVSWGAAAEASPALGGWVSYWDLRAGLAAVGAAPGRLSDVFLFAAHLDRDGEPTPALARQDAVDAVRRIRASGAVAWLTVVNDVVAGPGRVVLKDAATVHAVLADPARRRRHREKLVALARSWGVAGVDLDYERLGRGDRELFTTFVAELREDLRRAGLALSVTVQPETRADDAGADWAALCRSADRLQVMLYNEHGGRTEPGPIATPSWIDRVLAHALERCPAERIVPALKVIGMEWGPAGTRGVAFARAVALARERGAEVRRHADGEVPWFASGPPGARRTVYYEDARSLALKVDAAARRGATRVVLWTLGAEDPAFWDGQGRQSSAKDAPREP